MSIFNRVSSHPFDHVVLGEVNASQFTKDIWPLFSDLIRSDSSIHFSKSSEYTNSFVTTRSASSRERIRIVAAESVAWTPEIDLIASSFSSWSSTAHKLANGCTLMGLIMAVVGSVFLGVSITTGALQIAGLACLACALLLSSSSSVWKICSVVSEIFKTNHRLRNLQNRIHEQTVSLKRIGELDKKILNHHPNNAFHMLSLVFGVSAHRASALAYTQYRALLIQSLIERIVSFLLVTSVVLLFVFSGIFGLSALPTVVMGSLAVLLGIFFMVVSVRTILAFLGPKGANCKLYLQRAFANAFYSEELMLAPQSLVESDYSIFSGYNGLKPNVVSLIMRLWRTGAALRRHEIEVVRQAMDLLIDSPNVSIFIGKTGKEASSSDTACDNTDNGKVNQNEEDQNTEDPNLRTGPIFCSSVLDGIEPETDLQSQNSNDNDPEGVEDSLLLSPSSEPSVLPLNVLDVKMLSSQCFSLLKQRVEKLENSTNRTTSDTDQNEPDDTQNDEHSSANEEREVNFQDEEDHKEDSEDSEDLDAKGRAQ